MSNLGVGVMIRMLSGNESSVNAWKGSVGKKIASIKVDNNVLAIGFTDNTVLTLSDEGQSCCESRYMVCDDNLSKYVGGKLMGATLEAAPSLDDEYREHEVQFLHVKTSKGSFTVSNHNEHNGSYGGFSIEARLS